ncbi:MAG: hypothetical protein AMJ81_02075 [Phycisphaerae bacterium SM23_33]|nr:MAG: hypothetical protein AMJ81_02075 [Phycisphaerae bacterium SM23_33]
MARTYSPKIVMVGGGSYNWCPKLLRDIMLTDQLEGSEIVLLDPKLKAAREVQAAGEALARRWQKRFRIRATASEPAAFRQADFVVITISTGDLEMMAHDLAIPERYGIFQTVGDTVGPGGWSRSLRNVPVFVHLADRIEKYSPRAVVLNYTNPLACLTGALRRVSRLRSVGLCHGVFGNYRLLQRLFGCQEQELAVRFGGVNHFFWMLDFSVRGEPGYPLLTKRLGRKSLDEALTEGQTDEMGFHSHHALCHELYRQYGYLPHVADRHTCEFLPGYLTPRPAALKAFKLVRTSIAQRRAGRRRNRKFTLALAAGRLDPGPRSRETAVDIITAIMQHRPFCDVVNLPNEGQIDNLPRGAVVETLGLVDSLGFRPLVTGPLPPVLRQLVGPHCMCQLMTLEAALTGDRKLAFEALMTDPLCGHLPPSRVRRMGAELMAATRRWLPQFK